MGAVKFKGTVKKDERPYNGLEYLSADMIRSAERGRPDRVYALVCFEVTKVVLDVEDGSKIPTVRHVSVEPLVGEEADAAAKRIDELYRERTQQPGGVQPSIFDDGQDKDVAKPAGIAEYPTGAEWGDADTPQGDQPHDGKGGDDPPKPRGRRR